MSKIKLLLDLVECIRTTADSLEAIAQAMSDGDNLPKEIPAPKETPALKEEHKPVVSMETARQLAVELARKGKRAEIKELLGKYGVKNVSSIAEADLDVFYAELTEMEVE